MQNIQIVTDFRRIGTTVYFNGFVIKKLHLIPFS